MSKQYLRGSLHRSDLAPDPMQQFDAWYEDAQVNHAGDRTAVALATAGADGTPSVRMVLLKDHGPEGFTFVTNYESRKGRDLAENPRAALLFFWEDLERQIRIEGAVSRTSGETSDRLYNERALGSRIAAATSAQSQEIVSREELEKKYREIASSVGDTPARPQNWGGFVLSPHAFEFWQGGKDRLHDRFRYRRLNNAWEIARLQP